MSGEGRGAVETWFTRRLRASLAQRGAALRSPVEHRDSWLTAILDPQRMVFRGALMRDSVLPDELLQEALDTAAGVLLEVLRLEKDAWRGWEDPRLRRVLGVLRMAELPKEPPRAALGVEWERLRADVLFELTAPRAGDPPHTFMPFSASIASYLDRLQEAVEGIEFEEIVVLAPPLTACLSIPRHLLAERLRVCVDQHVTRVRRQVLPLAADLWSESFAAQRSATSLNRRRGDQERLEQGRALRSRSKLRYHLAAWILKQTGLRRVDIGLFLSHVDGTGLQSSLPETDDGEWGAGLEKEVDNSLAYWTSEAGSRGDGPVVQLGHFESEIRDLLRPVRA